MPVVASSSALARRKAESRARREMAAEGVVIEQFGSDAVDTRITEKWGGGNKILNTCTAYDEKGPLVKRRWPHLYSGADVERANGSASGTTPCA